MRQRNFYGTLWVTEADDEGWHAKIRTLYHGVITHGRQIYREDLASEPNTYYGHNSGVGHCLVIIRGAGSHVDMHVEKFHPAYCI